MSNIKSDIKKWDYNVLYDDTDKVFRKFNEIYSKDRESARYYALNRNLSSTRLVVFINKDIQVIVKEKIKYGVSITLKRYKSTTILEKYYFNTKNGLISKSKKGKFLYCKPNEVSNDVRSYIIGQKRWMNFIFTLDLPVTFNTIVKEKLYSSKKLLNWFWNTNFPTSKKLYIDFKKNQNGYLYNIKTFRKNILNLENINPEFFESPEFSNLFFNVLYLSTKTMRKINAAWSKRRFIEEYKKMTRHFLDKLVEYDNKELKIDDIYLPVINYLENLGYGIIKTNIELSKMCNSIEKYESCQNNIRNSLFIKKDNEFARIQFYEAEMVKHDKIKFYNNYLYEPSFFKSGLKCDFIVDELNSSYDKLVKIYERKNKIINILKNKENE